VRTRSGGGVLRRAFDLTFCGLLSVLALPLVLLAALAVRIDSPGPVLFLQLRLGRFGRPFRLLKLRTMVTTDSNQVYIPGEQGRITRVGRFLRYSKLDELPQLWNVLCGEMSLVGPRPVVPEVAEQFSVGYRHLLRVRPGLTDPATIKYCCEEEILRRAANPQEYFRRVATPEKIRISVAYMRRATLLTDVGVLAETVFAVAVSIARRSALAWLPAIRRRVASLAESGSSGAALRKVEMRRGEAIEWQVPDLAYKRFWIKPDRGSSGLP